MPSFLNNCPNCHSFRSIYIEGDQLACKNCSFKLQVICPICNIGKLEPTKNGLVCQHCNHETSTKTLEYIFSNKLLVHPTIRCNYCNGPTLAKENSNVTPRCFDYPNCGNQEDLFKETIEDEYVFLDLETTGLEIGNESIIEIGACKVDKTGKEYFFQEFVKPVGKVSDLITRITGINDDMLKNAHSLKTVLNEFLKFCGNAHIVAHNAQFDVPWLISSLLRHKFPVNIQNVLCTLNWAKINEEGKRSLGALSKKYNIGHESAHRALADAVVTKQLFYIYKQESEKDPPFEEVDRYLALSKKIMNQHPEFIQA